MILSEEQRHALCSSHRSGPELDCCCPAIRATERAVLEALIERVDHQAAQRQRPWDFNPWSMRTAGRWLRSLRDVSNEPPADWLDSSPAVTGEGDK